MKLIGFVKEHNNLKEAQPLKDFLGDTINDRTIVLKVYNYLNDGLLLLSWMGYFMDINDKTPMVPDSYYTDGDYVWPAYFPYYLKKYPNYKLDEEFLNHLSNNNFIVDDVKKSSINIKEWEKELSDKLNS